MGSDSPACEGSLGETIDVRCKVMGPTGWKLKTIPDTWRCAGEKRVIHVKEAIVIRALLRQV